MSNTLSPYTDEELEKLLKEIDEIFSVKKKDKMIEVDFVICDEKEKKCSCRSRQSLSVLIIAFIVIGAIKKAPNNNERQ